MRASLKVGRFTKPSYIVSVGRFFKPSGISIRRFLKPSSWLGRFTKPSYIVSVGRFLKPAPPLTADFTPYSVLRTSPPFTRSIQAMEEPRLLILEASGRTGEVALARGPVIVQHRLLDQTRLHARDLAPAVASMLSAEGWKSAEIQGLIINRGPGSYTGLRVGIMSAKAFAYATGCALIAVDGFTAVARQAPAEILQIAVIADAQQDRIYHQNFSRTSLTETSPASPLQIDPFADWLQRVNNGGWVTGP